MKILVYSHFFAPSVGGVETIVFSLARGLTEREASDGRRRFEVTLVTETPAGGFPDDRVPFRVVRNPSRSELRRLVRRADVLHVAGAALLPILLGLLSRKPVIVEHHGFQTICPTGQLLLEPENIPCPGHFMAGRHSYCLRCRTDQNALASFRLWILTFVRRFLCKRVAVNIAPTAWLASRLQLPRTEIIVHGLAPSEARMAPPPDPAIFAFVGRLVSTKGIDLLLEAARMLRDAGRQFQVMIIGDGPARRTLESRVSDWQLASAVTFLGRLSESQVRDALANASAIVVPSLGGEVFGLVVAENMLRGIPVIASDLGSFTEVLGGTGSTFRTGNTNDLARALAAFLDAPAKAAGLASAARQRILNNFSFGRMIEEHAQIYRRVAQ